MSLSYDELDLVRLYNKLQDRAKEINGISIFKINLLSNI
jgi:hypothetical protein